MEFERMASGSLSIVLQKPAYCENFEKEATEWINRIGAELIDRADSVVECVWTVKYMDKLFFISIDDWQGSITLEPQNDIDDNEMKRIKELIEKSV